MTRPTAPDPPVRRGKDGTTAGVIRCLANSKGIRETHLSRLVDDGARAAASTSSSCRSSPTRGSRRCLSRRTATSQRRCRGSAKPGVRAERLELLDDRLALVWSRFCSGSAIRPMRTGFESARAADRQPPNSARTRATSRSDFRPRPARRTRAPSRGRTASARGAGTSLPAHLLSTPAGGQTCPLSVQRPRRRRRMASTRPPGTYSPSARTGRRGGESGGVAGMGPARELRRVADVSVLNRPGGQLRRAASSAAPPHIEPAPLGDLGRTVRSAAAAQRRSADSRVGSARKHAGDRRRRRGRSTQLPWSVGPAVYRRGQRSERPALPIARHLVRGLSPSPASTPLRTHSAPAGPRDLPGHPGRAPGPSPPRR